MSAMMGPAAIGIGLALGAAIGVAFERSSGPTTQRPWGSTGVEAARNAPRPPFIRVEAVEAFSVLPSA